MTRRFSMWPVYVVGELGAEYACFGHSNNVQGIPNNQENIPKNGFPSHNSQTFPLKIMKIWLQLIEESN